MINECLKERKGKLDELLSKNPDVSYGVALSFLSSLDEGASAAFAAKLDEGDASAADDMRHHALRELILSKVREVVRKKPGGGGYVLYAPNPGKKGKSKSVGQFPTRLGARRAELARFPPKDPHKLSRLRKDVARAAKDPRKAAEKEKDPDKRNKASVRSAKKESVERTVDFFHRRLISKVITRSLVESLFREERAENEWDDYISKLSKQALGGDNKFVGLQKNIDKRVQSSLGYAFDAVKKAVGKSAKLKSFGVKQEPGTNKTYLAFSAEVDGVDVEPIYVHIDGGVPKLEVSSNAKVALTKVDPDEAKLFRAELVTVQERVLDGMDELAKAVGNRDKYLQKVETEVDSYVAGLTPLQVSLLKRLLVRKYRKLG